MDIFNDILLWDRESDLYAAVQLSDATYWHERTDYEYNRAIPRAICLMSRALNILKGVDYEGYSTA